MAHSSIEFDIQDMLLNGTQPAFVADELLKRWSLESLNEQDIHTICQFLIQCGFYASLCDHLAQQILKSQTLSWSNITYILKKFDAYIDQEVVDVLFKTVEDLNIMHLLAFMSHNENFLSPSSENNWTPHIKKVQDHLSQIWGDIKVEKSNFVEETKNAGPLDDHPVSEIQKSKALHPDEISKKDVPSQKTLNLHQHHPETSSKVFKDKMKNLDPKLQQESLIHRVFKKCEAESQDLLKTAGQEILPAFVKQAHKSPHYAYDLAIGLFVMEAYPTALCILDQHFASFHKAVDFLKLEIYSSCQNHLKLLEQIDKMSEKYVDEDPETILSLIYFKAKALWGLNKNHEAIALMSEVVKQQSDFRCANLTLSHWREVA